MAKYQRRAAAPPTREARGAEAIVLSTGRRRLLRLGLVLVFLIAITSYSFGPSSAPPFDISQATYVGRSACIECHAKEVKLYAGSHHDLAMDRATPETVLADFSGVELEHLGLTSRMFRDGDKYMVNTEGPDGQLHDYQVKYVFGVTPLQQYMVEFDVEPSHDENTLPRVQVLPLCWDTNQKKWFHLAPPDVTDRLDPSDDLHWTGIAQRWNNMCADCHSTNLEKGFDLKSLSYHTTFNEIDVSCEACHGPASKHIELARKTFPGWNRQRGYGLANLKRSAEDQIQACAPCHSRRSLIAGGYQPGDKFYDYFTDQLLTTGIYYPDGQVLDEDYIHGSFIQSKMYHKGIRCTDCHDPHTARLKHDGNQVCTSCHQHPTAKYDSVAHHFHKPGTAGASCVNCHMPATTYMEVDARHDHSLRVPRPDLSMQLDTPNACTGCHLKLENVAEEKRPKLKLYQDWLAAARAGDDEIKREIRRADTWSDAACEKWYGHTRRREEHFGQAIAAGQKRSPKAAEQLTRLLNKPKSEVPAIARATALQTLSEVNGAEGGQTALELIDDPHPLVRAAACDAILGADDLGPGLDALGKALDDPIRLVRTAAARNLLQVSADQHPPSIAPRLLKVCEELTQGIEANADRAGAHLSLAGIAEQQGRQQSAINHYRDAIRVEPGVTGARTNLAAMLDRNQQASSTGAAQVEQEIKDLRKAELKLLSRDVKLLPKSAPLQYCYGMALYTDGQKDESLKALLQAASIEPDNYQYTQAVTLMYKSNSDWPNATSWCERLSKIAPRAMQAEVDAIRRDIERKVP